MPKILNKFIYLSKNAAGAHFSKVPKLFGHISGDIILFVSSKRRRLKARNFAVILMFIPYEIYEKTTITEFYEWFFKPEELSGLSKRRAPGEPKREDAKNGETGLNLPFFMVLN